MTNTIIIHSPFIDPSYNLSYEDRLFDQLKEGERILFLWKNLPSVILGRSQNPWYEVNLPYLQEKKFSLLKRSSGGGTVYHDLGNLNISFMEWIPSVESMKGYQRTHLDLVLETLKELGIMAERNDRGDLLFMEKKISGSAYRLSKRKLLHHCTLLMFTQLPHLRTSLASTEKPFIQCRSVKSVTASVSNLPLEETQKKIFERNFRFRLGRLWNGDGFVRKMDHDEVSLQEMSVWGSVSKWSDNDRVYRSLPPFSWKGQTIDPKKCDLDFPWRS
jgi:lipoate-protein ligase A